MTAPTAEPTTTLDAETIEELQPPCDARFVSSGQQCKRPARYVAVVTCAGGVVRHRLYCKDDLELAATGWLFCTPHNQEHFAELLSWGELR